MTRDLEAYLDLERVMMTLDDANDSTADRIRDAMDVLWYRLDTDERASLDARGTLATAPAGVRLPLDTKLYIAPTPIGVVKVAEPIGPIMGWRLDVA